MEQFSGFNSFNSPNLDNNFERPVSPGIKKFTTAEFAKQLENLEMEPQQEIAAIGYFLLRQRADDLGVVINDFSLATVATFEEYQDHFREDFREEGGYLENAKAVYDPLLNKIASSRGTDASLTKSTHEMAHLISDKVNDPAVQDEKKNHIYRSGFDLKYTETDEAGLKKLNRSYFIGFNEGITEKIAHELCGDMTQEKLGALYREIFPKKAKQNMEKERQEYEAWLLKILPAEQESQRKELEMFTPFIATITDEKEKATLTKTHVGRMQSFQRMRDYRKKELEKMEILPFAGENDPLEDKDQIGYSDMVELLTPMLDGIAKKITTEKGMPLEKAKIEAWNDMQKAYIKGDTAYLNVLEITFGKGFLKKLANLDYKQIVVDEEKETTTWKEYDEIKTIIESAA